jgi:hypothetical protein
MNNSQMQPVIRRVVQLLVAGDYKAVERLSGGRLLTAEEIKEGIEEYGRTLVMPPDETFEELDVVETGTPNAPSYAIQFDLWTVEGGHSDLTLSLTLTRKDDDSYALQIDDLRSLIEACHALTSLRSSGASQSCPCLHRNLAQPGKPRKYRARTSQRI